MSSDGDRVKSAQSKVDMKHLLEEVDSLDQLRNRANGSVESEPHDELSKDEVFEVLSNARRREVIRYLVNQEGEATASEIAEHIAALENDKPVSQLSSSERKRVYVALYQNHLPKMDTVGVIDYNNNRGLVRLSEIAEQLKPFLDDPPGRRSDGVGREGMAVGAIGGAIALTASGVLGSDVAYLLIVVGSVTLVVSLVLEILRRTRGRLRTASVATPPTG